MTAENLSLIKIDPTDFSSRFYHDFYYLYNHPANNTWMYFSTRPESDFRQVCEDFFSKMDAVYLLQEQKSNATEIIGTCAIRQLPAPRHHVLSITSFTIDPAKHGKQYGKKFFALLKEKLQSDFREATRYELSYGWNNPVAHVYRFYEKNGFKDEVVWRDYFRSSAALYDVEINPYQEWLLQNHGDLRRWKNVWYADETVAAFIISKTEQTNAAHTALSLSDQKNVRNIDNKNKRLLTTRLATKNDLNACITLYHLSNTEWGFLNIPNLQKNIGDAVQKKQLWMVEEDNHVIGICHIVISPFGLEHTAEIKQLNVLNNDIEASQYLFKGLMEWVRVNHAQIKRLELILADNETHLRHGAISNKFQYRGTMAARFKTRHGNVIDEHAFDAILFNLNDAISLCQNKMASELFFAENPHIPYPFSIQVTFSHLQGILNLLEDIKTKMAEENIHPLINVEINIFYQMIKLICSQDFLKKPFL